ncbi:MAG: metallophosphoesterase [Planctomycetes bacterium]|nr:metallophosphoesterase [Planctomycetota bacterium]
MRTLTDLAVGCLVAAPLAVPICLSSGAGTDLHWHFSAQRLANGFAVGGGTPALAVAKPVFAPEKFGGGLIMNGKPDTITIGKPGALSGVLPTRAMTVAAWVAIEMPRAWGGVIGCVQDNGDYEKGWVLGYREEIFTFGLSTKGADDGNGKLTYLSGKTRARFARWHHVAATFDGAKARLFVDGKLEAESITQSGDLLYDAEAPFVIGAYKDKNEHHPHDGRILDLRLQDRAATAAEIGQWYRKRVALRSQPLWTDLELGFLVAPYLTWPTRTAMSVMCETTRPSQVSVRYRLDHAKAMTTTQSRGLKRLHEVRLTGLEPDAKYFYQIVAHAEDGSELEGELLSFRTAVSADRPFTFIAIGDTQSQPEVVKRVSDRAYEHRPNLVVHAGDLVTTGTDKSHWTGHFFPNMQPLIGRVPLMPVLGNHEQDAPYYYRYMSLPEPERWYSFEFGNAEFFMIDGNRSLADSSAQLTWLAKALAKSKATWKFAVLHQPPYTSDSNDYGDTKKTSSKRGDPNANNIAKLLERHGVDICFSGHVHDYERTFPIKKGRVNLYRNGAVIYVTCAGGGGHLEDFDPANTWFGNKKARCHHMVFVAINGPELEFQAIDEHGRLFDVLTLDKRTRKVR